MTDADGFAQRLAEACARWSLRDPVQIADTPTSFVFKVHASDGTFRALKLLKPYGLDEMIGVNLLDWYAGDGAVEIVGRTANDILMQWLNGETLGDMVRRGEDERATDILCDVIMQLQRPRGDPPSGLMTMSTQCQPLLESDLEFWPEAKREMGFGLRKWARELLETSPSPIPLHGDLHHDNLVHSPDGWKVIDAKGLVGDPAYEFSNIFRNPVGAADLVSDPDRIARMADLFAVQCRQNRYRILKWAAVHSALSTFWNRNAGNPIDEDLDFLPLIVRAVDSVSGRSQ